MRGLPGSLSVFEPEGGLRGSNNVFGIELGLGVVDENPRLTKWLSSIVPALTGPKVPNSTAIGSPRRLIPSARRHFLKLISLEISVVSAEQIGSHLLTERSSGVGRKI